MSKEYLARSHARRAAMFIAVGVLNTLIDIGTFTCLYQFAGFDVISSNVLAFLVAVTNSYIMNRFFTFGDRRGGGVRRFARYLTIAVTAMTVSTAIVYLISQFTHPLIGKLVATVASTVINYIGSHRFVFTAEQRAARS
jgi:putative flippase GtrA